MNPILPYVLVTPARNEDRVIGSTITAVTSQTLVPAEWIIVSDGSTDRTDELIRSAARHYPWIRLLRLPPRPAPGFAAVVQATEAGVRALATPNYHYIGLLDADIRFAPDYFEQVIRHFESSPRLGLAGGMVVDLGERKDLLPRNRRDVPGAVQFFRRTCFEALNGLHAIPEGGWDSLTCARARMRGFTTALLTDLVVDHLKPRNISQGGIMRRRWQMGLRDYAVGYHPLFEFCKCISRFLETPPFIGTMAWWGGYCWAALHRQERLVPADLLRFIRREQLRRLIPLHVIGVWK